MNKTRYIPYGYTVKDGKTIIEHDEARVIRKIFDSYISGNSLKDIADELTSLGIPYTEKQTVWDKARISRIIENSRYMGTEEYAPIIDEEIYENALLCKRARNTNTNAYNSEAIATIRNHIKCGCCGSPMVRRIAARNRIKESWVCANDECGMRVRMTDHALLEKLTILINRIIENQNLLMPKEKKISGETSQKIQQMQNSIDEELSRYAPSEDYIIDMIKQIANERYRQSDATELLAIRMTQQRTAMMQPQEEFNINYFKELIEYITLDEYGKVTLTTKTKAEVTERTDNG